MIARPHNGSTADLFHVASVCKIPRSSRTSSYRAIERYPVAAAQGSTPVRRPGRASLLISAPPLPLAQIARHFYQRSTTLAALYLLVPSCARCHSS
jgi:hypothetical protein